MANDRGRTVAVLTGIVGGVILLVAVAYLSRDTLLSRKEVDLSGPWLLRLPAGFQHKVALTREGPERYILNKGSLNFNGLYEFKEGNLVMLKPKDPRLTEFKWRLEPNGTLTLVGQPEMGKTGANYLGATLTRE
jgi:hypothetical protein